MKIHELPVHEFTDDSIDHCLYVENINTPEMKHVPLRKVFEWIKSESLKNGLAVELKEDRILFIGNR